MSRTTQPFDPRASARGPVAAVLLAGVLLATILFAAGLAMRFLRPAGSAAGPAAYATYQPQPASLRGVAGVLGGVAAMNADAVLLLGVLVLVLTPALRVLVAGVGFAAARDRAFTLIAAIVLAGLALGASGVIA